MGTIRAPVGGMAIVEGVFLRGPQRWAAAARQPDGAIAVRTGAVPPWARRWSGVPLARGIVALAEALGLGVRAMLWSGDLQQPRHGRSAGDVSGARLIAALIPALAFTIGLVFLVPAVVVDLAAPAGVSATTSSAIEAVTRCAVVIAYVAAVGRLGVVRRVFAYHGAEHKVVALYESDSDDRTVDAARTQSMRHGRCGTTFLAVVLGVTSVTHLAMTPLHDAPLPALLAGRLAVVPLVAAVAYEILTAANRRADSRLGRLVLAPGMALQSWTVVEPDDDQLAVALVALEAVLAPAPAVEGATTAVPTLAVSPAAS